MSNDAGARPVGSEGGAAYDPLVLLERVMWQAEADLSAAHEEICKLQGLDPKTHTWPQWSSPANTIRWFKEIRAEIDLATRSEHPL